MSTDPTATVPAPAPLADEAQRIRLREDLDTTFFVQAGAGSGKSTAMVGRILTLIDSGIDILSIAAITFTEKAALELRGKIRAALQQEAPSELSRTRRAAALVDLDSSPIGTIHSFCQRILRTHPLEAGLPPRLEVEDDAQSASSHAMVVRRLLRETLEDPTHAEGLVELQQAGMGRGRLAEFAEELLKNWHLTEAWLAAEDPRSAMRAEQVRAAVRAYLRTSEEALASLDYECKRSLTTADELRPTVEQLTAALDASVHPGLQDCALSASEARRLLEAVSATKQIARYKDKRWGSIERTVEVFTSINDLRASLIGQLVDALLLPILQDLATRMVAAVRERIRSGRLEFLDLLVLSRDLLRHPEHHARIHADLHRQYARILIDEFQDTDPLQAELLVRIAAESSQPEAPWESLMIAPGHLFVVGDPKQSIYRFRRADIAVYERVRETVLASGGDVVSLTTNFRSDAGVLDWVNAVFSETMTAKPGVQSAFEALAPRPGAPRGIEPIVLSYAVSDAKGFPAARNAEELAAAVAQLLEEPGPDGAPLRPQDIAILLRTRAHLGEIEDALDARGIEFRTEASNLIYGTMEVRELILLLRAAANPADTGAIILALRTSLLGCGDDDLAHWRLAGGGWSLRHDDHDLPAGIDEDHPVAQGLSELARLRLDARTRQPADLLQGLIDTHLVDAVLLDSPRHRDLVRRLTFIVDQARAWWESEHGSLREYLGFVAQQDSDNASKETVLDEQDSSAVRLLTMHSAKGLEFPAVVLSTTRSVSITSAPLLWDAQGRPVMAIGEDLHGSGYSAVQEDEKVALSAENLRQMYVATTRAEHRIIVPSYAAADEEKEKEKEKEKGKKQQKKKIDGEPTPLKAFLNRAHDLSTPAAEHDEAGLVSRYRTDAPVTAPSWRTAWEESRRTWQEASSQPLTRAVTSIAHAPGAVDVAQQEGAALSAPDALVPTQPTQEAPAAIDTAADASDDTTRLDIIESGTAIGTALHRILELTRLDANADVPALVTQVAGPDSNLSADRLIDMAQWALGSKPLLEARASGRFWFELDVVSPGDAHVGGPEPAVLVGRADLAYVGADGRLNVVDFKSDTSVTRQRREEYGIQVRRYLAEISRVTGLPAGCALLLFAAPEMRRCEEA